MHALWHDLRFSFRMMHKAPGITVLAVLSIALGIGANTTIFTWIKAILLKPMPGVAAPQELIDVCGTNKTVEGLSVSYPDFVDYRNQNQSLSGLIGFRLISSLNLGHAGTSNQISGNLVTGNYFDVLGVKPVLGRSFLPEEDQKPNAAPVVVISFGLWQNRFGGNPNIVGQDITLNGFPFKVVGVAPRFFTGTYTGLVAEVWVPIMMQEKVVPLNNALTNRTNRWLNVMGRLKPGVSIEQAQANLSTVAANLVQTHPEVNDSYTVTVYEPRQSPNGPEKRLMPVFGLLLAVVGLVLLIACANVANLLLSRAASRRKEISVRLALGAGRGRIVRQLLTESLVLAGLGGGLGILLAYWTVDTLMWFIPPITYRVWLDLSLDQSVFGYSLLLTCLTGLLFGLAPALQASKSDLVTTLKDEAGSVSMSTRKSFLRNALVVAQVALTVVTLVCGGLFLRSLTKSQTANPGFELDHRVLATFDLFSNGYDETRGKAFCQQVLSRIRTKPGVESACLSRRVPLGVSGSSSSVISIEGYHPPPDENLNIVYEVVSPGFFETLGIPLKEGRDFSDFDTEKSPQVVIINQTMAERYWPGISPLGKRISTGGGWKEIIGVARNFKYRALNEIPQPLMFLPVSQNYRSTFSLLVRTHLGTAAALDLIQNTLKAVDPNLAIFERRTLRESAQGSLFASRIAASLLSLMGVLALIMASIGLYGVLSYSVTQRTREIGIRVALGAQAGDLFRLIVGEGFMLISMGVAAGLAVALVVGRLVGKLLYGVGPADPLTFGVVLLVLFGVGFIACFVPFLKALRIDPMTALRYE